MVFFGGALGLLALAVWIFCIIDVVTTPRDQVRNLPKLAWIAVVVLLIDLGSVAWLLAGRPWGARAAATRGAVPAGGTSAGPSPFATSPLATRRKPVTRPMSPDDDEDFLAELSKRNKDQRRSDTDD